MTLRAELTLINWEETAVENQLSQAKATYQIAGEFSGSLTSTYVIYYTKYNPLAIHDGISTYIGYGYFSGQIAGQEQEIVIEEKGKFEAGVTTGDFTFPDGSGRYFLLDGKMMIEIN